MCSMSELESSQPRPYTREEIYGLVSSYWLSRGYRLGDLFNHLPYALDGTIAIDETTIDRSPTGEDVGTVSFNDQLPTEQLAALRLNPNEYVAVYNSRKSGTLTPEQEAAKVGLRSSVARIAGRVVVSGTTAVAGIELGGMIASPLVENTLGAASLVVALGVAGSDLLLAKQQARKQATDFARHVKERFLDTDQGRISLPRANAYQFQAEAWSEAGQEDFAFLKTRAEKGKHPEHAIATGLCYMPDSEIVCLVPGRLVLRLLHKNPRPGELWCSGFGDQVRELAAADRQLQVAWQAKNSAEGIHKFTGVENPANPAELAQRATDYRDAQENILRITAVMVRQHEEREQQRTETARFTAAKETLDLLISGDVKDPHPLEVELQTLADIACKELSRLNLSQQSSQETIRRLADYLRGTRLRLTKHDQIEQFYRGLHKKFSEQLPDLPAWEAVAEQFNTVSRLL